jgi:hypothetical protein
LTRDVLILPEELGVSGLGHVEDFEPSVFVVHKESVTIDLDQITLLDPHSDVGGEISSYLTRRCVEVDAALSAVAGALAVAIAECDLGSSRLVRREILAVALAEVGRATGENDSARVNGGCQES